MEKNCLVTVLSTFVDVESPIYMSALKMRLSNNSKDKSFVIEVSDGDTYIVLPKGVTLSSDKSLTETSTEETNTYLLGKSTTHNLLFSISGSETNYFFYLTNPENIKKLYSDVSDSSLRFVDIKDFQHNEIATRVGSANIFSLSTIEGTLSDLTKSPLLTNMSLGNSALSGTIESIAENGWNANRRSGTLLIEQLGNEWNRIKLNNVSIQSNQNWSFIFEAEQVTVKQSSAIVATYDGSTWTYNP